MSFKAFRMKKQDLKCLLKLSMNEKKYIIEQGFS